MNKICADTIRIGSITASRLRSYNELSNKERYIFEANMIKLKQLMYEESHQTFYHKIIKKLTIK